MIKYLVSAVIIGIAFFAANISPALADIVKPWQVGLQDPVTPVFRNITDFHTLLLWIITAITIFVMVLLLFVMWRFSAKRNPKPSTTTHNLLIEIIWTAVPVLILLVIAIPSFKLLYYADRIAEPEMTLNVTGHQWYWSYEYPDYDGLSFSSNLIPEDEIDKEAGEIRLLSTDNKVVLPVDTNIQIIITASDVIHSWAMPAFGVKTDAIPGRINETWARIEEPGVYFGQCSEVCGINHAYMPIEVHAVSKEEFAQWVEKAKTEY